MRVYAKTEKGPLKTENQDRIVIGKTILAEGLYEGVLSNGSLAIADGVGGNPCGDIAAHIVAQQLTMTRMVSMESLKTINEYLISFSQQDKQYARMATTLSGIDLNTATVYHIGNTRVFLLQNGKYLKQLTEDDTAKNAQPFGSFPSEASQQNEVKTSAITACFGGGSVALFRPKVFQVAVASSPVIITSDGIHDYLSIDEMEEVLSMETSYLDKCNTIVDLSRSRGSLDDASILLGVEE